MKYKGYMITIAPADDIRRTDELGRETTCEGFNIKVFKDKEKTELFDEFSAAVGHEILENSVEEAEQFAKDTIICEEKELDVGQDEMSMQGVKRMEQLILNTSLVRKEPAFEVRPCVVEKAIGISHKEFEHLRTHALEDNDIIAKNKDSMWFGVDDKYHCLLVYDNEQGDGLLVESEGYDYARYAQYIPQAKLIWQDHCRNHLNEMRFICPLSLTYHKDAFSSGQEADPCRFTQYANEINRGIRNLDLPEEKEHGLMHWYNFSDKNDPIKEKVYSAHCSVEAICGELKGVIMVKTTDTLSNSEIIRLSKYFSGQLSDGWGESLEQKQLSIGNGYLNVAFWSNDPDWYLAIENNITPIIAKEQDETEDEEMDMRM